MYYLWSRNKHVARENVEGMLRITTSVNETFFAASITIVVRLSDLQITSVKAEMPRPINDECRAAVSLINEAVGLRVASGLTKQVDDLIGGSNGCTHMANLLLESCHTAAVSFRQVKMAEALAAGLSPEDFYREWINTRPKELRNSCIAFKDDSPLIARLKTAGARPAPDLGARLSSGTVLPVVAWSRNKLVGVGRVDPETFLSRATLEDNAHTMQVEVEIRRSDLEIVAVRGHMLRVPNDVCSRAVASLQHAVGLGLRPGLTVDVDERVGRNGCPHLANLMLEACHGVIQGTLGAIIEDSRASGEVQSWDGVRRAWQASMPMLRNSCIAYCDSSPLMRRIAPAAIPLS